MKMDQVSGRGLDAAG